MKPTEYPTVQSGYPIPPPNVRPHKKTPRKPHPLVEYLRTQVEHGDSVRIPRYQISLYRYAASRLGLDMRWQSDGHQARDIRETGGAESTISIPMVRLWFLNPGLTED